MDRVDIRELDHFEDERGLLVKIMKREYLDGSLFGEIYFTTAHPGITRAMHYHKHTNEWFCVMKGEAKLVLQDIETLEKEELTLGSEKFLLIKVPAGTAHVFKNIGKENMYLLAVADKPYDPRNTDTYPFNIDVS